MKRVWLLLGVMVFQGAAAYGGGLSEADLVEVRELPLEGVEDVEVLYRWQDLSLRQHDGEGLILKEYMSKDEPRYYAAVSRTGGALIIEQGPSPGRFSLRPFNARAEVLVPKSYRNALTVKTTSGEIAVPGELRCRAVRIESSSGGVRAGLLNAEIVEIRTSSGGVRGERLKGESAVRTTSGSITLDAVEGGLLVEAASGGVRLGRVTGSLSARTSSGGIHVDAVEGDLLAEATSGGVRFGRVAGSVVARTSSGGIQGEAAGGSAAVHTRSGGIALGTIGGDVSASASSGNIGISLAQGGVTVETSSGGVTLAIPRDFAGAFSAWTSSGSVSTPFAAELSSPVSDRKLVRGVIGASGSAKAISIQTSSGAIRVGWNR